MSEAVTINYWTIVSLTIVGIFYPKSAFGGLAAGMVAWWFLQKGAMGL